MKFRPAILTFWFSLLLAFTARAHSPFDCSARIIFTPGAAEIAVVTGRDLAEVFLQGSPASTGQIAPMATARPLPLTLAGKILELSIEGKTIVPQSLDVFTDGLEFMFRMKFTLPPTAAVQVQATCLPRLKAPRALALIATDENGNGLGSAIFSPGHEVAELVLPPELSAATSPVTNPTIATATSSPAVAATEPVAVAPPTPPSFGEFFKLGIGHILAIDAFDHLLFLTALLLGCRRLKPMLLVITGFTVAHSLTLALAVLQLVSLSSHLIEPLIAASIIFVALENFRDGEASWSRYALTGGFGLIHGFGFAGALQENGLGGTGWNIVKPLFAFNLGVEIGQLAVAAVLLPGLFALRKWPWFARWGTRLVSAVVIVVAAFWLWQRITNLSD